MFLLWQQEPGCTADTATGGISFIRELYERQGSQEKSVWYPASFIHISHRDQLLRACHCKMSFLPCLASCYEAPSATSGVHATQSVLSSKQLHPSQLRAFALYSQSGGTRPCHVHGQTPQSHCLRLPRHHTRLPG